MPTNQPQTPREVPAGPADAKYPRRALARLAVSEQARQLAERATNALVPTGSDSRGDAAEEVQIAYQLLDDARALLTRTVIHARERGVSWETIGAEHGDITRQSAQERYADAVADWTDALDRPTEPSGPFLASRLPDGLVEPERTAARLDAWTAAHVADGSFQRRRGQDQGAGMVSTGLEAHNALTRWNTALRYGQSLREREQAGEPVSDAEWACFAELKASARAATETEAGQQPPGAGEA